MPCSWVKGMVTMVQSGNSFVFDAEFSEEFALNPANRLFEKPRRVSNYTYQVG
jgi:hypothetical protein